MPTALADPIFVVGCPRSGTTLVQNILAAHSGAFSLPETHFFNILQNQAWAPEATLTAEQVAKVCSALHSFGDLQLPPELVAELVAGAPRPAHEIFETAVELFRPADDQSARARRLVEKTPLHVLCLADIARTYPTARFVHIIRSPLDMTSSWLQTPFATSTSMQYYADVWNRCLAAADRFAAAQPGRLHALRYEDLVANAPEQVQAICRFLELSFEPEMLSTFGAKAQNTINTTEYWKNRVMSSTIQDRRGAWRKTLTRGQAWLIEEATRPQRARHGYRAEAGAHFWHKWAARRQQAQARAKELAA